MLKNKELKLKNTEELQKILQEERVRLRELCFKLSGAQVKNFHEVKFTKRNIARLLTILRGIEIDKQKATINH